MPSPALLPALPQDCSTTQESQWSGDQNMFQILVLVRLETGGGPCGDLVVKFHTDVAELNGNRRQREQRDRIVLRCLWVRRILLVGLRDEFETKI